jgi:hypothetical protein
MEGGTDSCKPSYASTRQTRRTNQDYFTKKPFALENGGLRVARGLHESYGIVTNGEKVGQNPMTRML